MNRARYMPQNPVLLATKSPNSEVCVGIIESDSVLAYMCTCSRIQCIVFSSGLRFNFDRIYFSMHLLSQCQTICDEKF